MKQIYVILEENITLNEEYGEKGKTDVIGVADSKEVWENMINEYYGCDVVGISTIKDVRDSGIEYVYCFYEGDEDVEHYVEITIMSYQLNQL